MPRLLDNLDADAVAQLRGETERIGGDSDRAELRRIERTADRLSVVYQEGRSERTVDAERVVNGAGRLANVDVLDLAAGKVPVGTQADRCRYVPALDVESGGVRLRRRRRRNRATFPDRDL